jgi:hypothetical protein
MLCKPRVHYRTHKIPPPVPIPSLFHSKGSIRVWCIVKCFVTKPVFLRWGVVTTSPNPQAGGPPLAGCPQLLVQCTCSYPAYRRPFLHPQREDAPPPPVVTWAHFLTIKTNQMHYFSTLFRKELYIFRTDLLSIIRSLNTVYAATGICLASYVDCLLARAGWNWSLSKTCRVLYQNKFEK